MASAVGPGQEVDEELRAALTEAGQEHVLQYIDAGLATEAEAAALVQQVQGLNLQELNAIFKGLGINNGSGSGSNGGSSAVVEQEEAPAAPAFAPLKDAASVASTPSATLEEWEAAGLAAIREGKVAALVLSGGQGTRLGFDGPKGMYDIGLPSGKPIFQLLAERVRGLSRLAGMPVGRTLPFYVMTSPLNHDATRAFFERHAHFGLDPSDVVFFPQGTMPCFSLDGKLLMDGPGSIAQAPDGNGSLYPSLLRTGALADMKRRGVECLHVFSVDNVLVKVADPVFVGYCRSLGADCGNKVVWKAHAHEKVGVVVQRGGRPAVVEYSEMDDATKQAADADGKLLYGAGNICSHFFTVAFIENKVLPNLAGVYHAARKKIPCVAFPGTEAAKPQRENGVKLEAFIFDVFPLSERMALLEVAREDEFAPVKDAPGGAGDTPEKARRMLSEEAKRWVRSAGAAALLPPPVVGTGGEGLPPVPAAVAEGGGEGEEEEPVSEISPLVSYKGEGLEGRVAGMEVQLPVRFLS